MSFSVFFAKIKNCLNLLGGLWSFIKHFVWFLDNFGVMAAGQSPPGQPGFTIQPLKLDREIPGGGRQYWLKKDDSKQHFKHKYIYTYQII